MNCHRLPWAVHELLWTVHKLLGPPRTGHGLPWTTMGYHELPWTKLDYQGRFKTTVV